jgi:hypothetical protein
MRTPTLSLLSALGCAALLGSVAHVVPVAAQSATSAATPDFTGLWDGAPGGPGTRDLGKYMKSQKLEIPFTALGAERYKNVDLAKNPNAYCLPPGPSRALTGPSPFYIVQHKNVISFNFENHGVYRVVYLDGTKHPEDIADYPQFMGHSTGKWEGKTLVVDTVGINDRTWLDSYGLEHSDKLHLTERFESIDANTIKYTVTYDDPVFFTKPWSATLNMARQNEAGDRLMEYVCNDNEKDRANLVPTPREE